MEKAQEYRDCYQIVFEKVKPERDQNNRTQRRERWWQFAERAPELYASIKGLGRVLARARVSNTNSIAFVSEYIVCSDQVVVFTMNDFASLALLQSTISSEWISSYASSLRTDVRYTPSDCFDTFAFPVNLHDLNSIGQRYYEHRQEVMLTQKVRAGLTKTYNRFHNPEETSADIQKLRQLHVEMDHAVAAAYGWTDLDLGHGFHSTKQGTRYTLSETARREVLARLLRLNHERYEDEVRRGLHNKDKKKAKSSKTAGASAASEGEAVAAAPVTAEGHDAPKKRGRPAGAKKKSDPDPSGGAQGSLF